MLKRSAMVISLVIFALLGFACSGKEAAPPDSASRSPKSESAIEAGPNQLVSAAHAQINNVEVYIGGNPRKAGQLVACAIMEPTRASSEAMEETGTTIAYVTRDGGKTWTTGVTPKPFSWDPACTYDSKGTAYFITMQQPAGAKHGKNSLLVFRSTDGIHWSSTHFSPATDRPFIATTSSAKADPPIYADFLRFERPPGQAESQFTQVVRSDDGGRTFSATGTLPDSALSDTAVHPLATSDGTLILLGTKSLPSANTSSSQDGDSPVGSKFRNRFVSKPDDRLAAVVSSDRGQTFSQPITISDMYSGSSDQPAVDPGSSLFKDRLYVAWTDARTGHQQILLAYSDDKGKTWSTPRVVSDEREAMDINDGPDQDGAEVAVNKFGVVGVSWKDRRDIPTDKKGYYIRFSASLDGGDTWLPSVRVSESPYDENGYSEVAPDFDPPTSDGIVAAHVYDSTWAGHTAGIAADADGGFHPIWVDNRNHVLQVWSATVTVNGLVTHHGSVELDPLQIITKDIKFDTVADSFDPATHILTMDARLKNTSNRALHGPIKVKVLDLSSRLGIASIVDADNGVTGNGAVWDFTSKLKDATLAPSASSAMRRLTFRIEDLRPLKRNGYFVPPDLVDFQMQVYARR